MGSVTPRVPHADAARVVLYSRAGCHLCEQAEQVVAFVCGGLGASWVSVDIDADTAAGHVLRELFTEQVPVTYVDGRQHDFWRVDAGRLRRAIAPPG